MIIIKHSVTWLKNQLFFQIRIKYYWLFNRYLPNTFIILLHKTLLICLFYRNLHVHGTIIHRILVYMLLTQEIVCCQTTSSLCILVCCKRIWGSGFWLVQSLDVRRWTMARSGIQSKRFITGIWNWLSSVIVF